MSIPSVRVDCWRSSSIFQMFLATGSSQEEGKIFWFILLSSLFFSCVGMNFVVYTCFLHFFPLKGLNVDRISEKNSVMPFKSLFLRYLDAKAFYNTLPHFSVAILDLHIN